MEIKIELKEYASMKKMHNFKNNINYIIYKNGLTEIIESIIEKV